MSNIYDIEELSPMLDAGRSLPSVEDNQQNLPPQGKLAEGDKQLLQDLKFKELKALQERSSHAIALVDDILLKNYLTRLSNMQLKKAEDLDTSEIVLYKINKMVYEKDEYATDKYISVLNSMTYAHCSVFLIIDGNGNHTDFYLGIRNEGDKGETTYVASTFERSLKGQFPGIQIEDWSEIKAGHTSPKQEQLLSQIRSANSVSSFVGIPSYKKDDGDYTNASFIQGVEKFATAMQGKNYTAIILASNMPSNEINQVRSSYEQIFTELSGTATQQLTYSTNESLANAISRTKGYNDTETSTITDTLSTSHTHTHQESHTKNESTSRDNAWGKIGKTLGAVAGVAAGAAITIATGGIAAPAGVAAGLAIAGGVAGLGSGATALGANQKTNGTSDTTGESDSDTTSKARAESLSKAHTDMFSQTDGSTSTIGSGKNFMITVQNKHVQELLKRIDKQLERIEMCESTGLWSAGAYFMSYETDNATAEIAAAIFRSIIQGENSGIETSAINTWYGNNVYTTEMANILSCMKHPLFCYDSSALQSELELPATSLISSKELAMMMGLPRKSVPGLPVVEHAILAKEVVRIGVSREGRQFDLGCIYDQGVAYDNNKVTLDMNSLCQHTFVTGSTGCGKSNTIYYLLNQIRNDINAPKFLIIEPAKGEYKNVFGNENIYGTNPLLFQRLLKINPFRFPQGVHVLEHVDRLIEIFNVCWPMYAAMPAVLKEATLNAYESCGWNLYKSENKFSQELFPSFSDLLYELVEVIEHSAYSEEVKSNYTGSLVTRVKSLCNGVYQHIFSPDEIGDEKLFDENVIVDLSRIGSETKSFIMGILIMRLNEYRANCNIKPNCGLRHITVLEEAHNILRKCSMEQNMEGSNLAGKSVEMISNAIAEMRTYGEGFIIVDQSPGAIDISAIRNTNTKIIMRLPESNDRLVAGKASAMRDNQIDEIAKLPTGVAVVYQNDWEEPVLCQIEEYKGKKFSYNKDKGQNLNTRYDENEVKSCIVQFLLQGRVADKEPVYIEDILLNLNKTNLPSSYKWRIFELIEEYKQNNTLTLWDDDRFKQLAQLISIAVAEKAEIRRLIQTKRDFEGLTEAIVNLVYDSIPNIPASLVPEICHCLMCDYSLGGDDNKAIYNAWLQNIKKC